MNNILTYDEFLNEYSLDYEYLIKSGPQNNKKLNLHTMMMKHHQDGQRKLLMKHPFKGAKAFSPEEKKKWKEHEYGYKQHYGAFQNTDRGVEIRTQHPILGKYLDKKTVTPSTFVS